MQNWDWWGQVNLLLLLRGGWDGERECQIWWKDGKEVEKVITRGKSKHTLLIHSPNQGNNPTFCSDQSTWVKPGTIVGRLGGLGYSQPAWDPGDRRMQLSGAAVSMLAPGLMALVATKHLLRATRWVCVLLSSCKSKTKCSCRPVMWVCRNPHGSAYFPLKTKFCLGRC